MAEPAQKKAKTERVFLFSSESVNEGHPDKLCDQVSDAVLDTCLASDPKSKVACETATKDNMVMVAGEITTQAKIDLGGTCPAGTRSFLRLGALRGTTGRSVAGSGSPAFDWLATPPSLPKPDAQPSELASTARDGRACHMTKKN